MTPTFSTPVATATGFTVNVTNYSSLNTFSPTSSSGSSVTKGTPVGTILPLTVMGFGAGQSETLAVSVSRSGYATGTAIITGRSIALIPGLVPTFGTPTPTATGFTFSITNYSSLYTFTPVFGSGLTVTKGSPSGTTLPLTVTGLIPGQSAAITISVTRTGYAPSSGTLTANALKAALTSTFTTPVIGTSSFTVNVSNYDPLYTYAVSTTGGVASKGAANGSTLPITVSGLTSSNRTTAVLTVTVTRMGYVTGVSAVTG